MLRLIFLALFMLFSVAVNTMPNGPTVGQAPPDISLPGKDGQQIQLSQLKGKMVLLNFWSTWCVACNVVKNPEYVRIWNNFKDFSYGNADEFTFYSVAFDKDKSKWLRKIQEQDLDWPYHVNDEKSYYSPLWKTFGMRSIPTSFLIDERGKIIGVNLTETQISQELTKRKTGPKRATRPVSPPPPPPQPVTVVVPPAPRPAPQPQPQPQPVTVVQPPAPVTQPTVIGPSRPVNPPTVIVPPKPVPMPTPPPTVVVQPPRPAPQPQPVTVVQPPAPTPAPQPQPQPRPIYVPPAPPAPSTITVQKTMYKIQLGAFRHPNLNKFSRLADLGNLEVEPYTSSVSRVLLGAYEYSQAQRTLGTVKSRGFDGFLVRRTVQVTQPNPNVSPPRPIVPPAPTAPPIVVAPPVSGNSGGGSTSVNSGNYITRDITSYKIQIGVYRYPDLNKFKPIAHIGKVTQEPVGSTLTRVLFGKYSSRWLARRALTQIRTHGFNGFVVSRTESETVHEADLLAVTEGQAQKPQVFYQDMNNGGGQAQQQGNNKPATMENKPSTTQGGDRPMEMFDISFADLSASMVNQAAPEILLNNPKGVPLSLSSQRGKLTLVYLWAPWSGYARATHKDLVKIYEKYRGEHFEIFSVAFTRDEQHWKDVIEEDHLAWNIHVIEKDGVDSYLLGKYNVEYLPAMFLVDVNGKIVTENIPYEQLDAAIGSRIKK